jgi:uncharacterized membrane protein YfcA
MIIELALIGIGIGVLSGFFGIGGGTILVPALLLMGFDMKTAIGISVVQMVFASVYGSYLNSKKGTLDIKMVSAIGVGGFVGAQLSPYIVAGLDAVVLETIFLGFVLFALSRLYFKTLEQGDVKTVHPLLLFIIGMVIGVFSISIGVGGSILLVPILVGFLHIPLKNAVSAGLFFVVFSSISGFIGFSLNGQIDFESGVLIGIASMAGVALGIWFKHRSSDLLQKRLIVLFYLVVALYLIYRLVTQHG